MELRKGQKIPLNENFLSIRFEKNSTAVDIDTSAFLAGANGKVAGDEDFIFYGNPRHNSGGVVYRDDSIEIDLTKIPRHVEKISLTATIYDADVRKQNFSMIRGAVLRLKNSSGSEIATFPLENFTVETAIVLGEIYRHKGAWKFNATGAGFSGGLAALCKNFGIEVSDEMTAPPTEPPKINSDKPKIDTRREKSSPPTRIDTRQENPPPPKKIELRKGQKINLVKKDGALGEIVINLNWNQPERTGFFGRVFSRGIDLDLCCLFELKDGSIGAIQALGKHFGSLTRPPYISLDGDDRTGSVAAGETIRVNGKFVNKIQRILVFTFIYEGAANWEEAKGVVTVKCPGSPELVVRMDEYGSNLHTCAIALLENVGNTFSVEKVVNFYHDSKEMDEDFDWGLQWVSGRKD